MGSLEVQQALEDAIYTAGLLEQIARAARGLFQFTPCRPEEAARFLAQDGSDTLAQDVNELGNVLQDIRINNLASRADLMQLTEVRGRIQRDLWDRELPLQNALHRYIVPLRRTFCESMRAAQNSFIERNRECKAAFDKCLPQLEADLVAEPEIYVLVDPFLLHETLRNVCSNVRHTLTGAAPTKAEIDFGDRVTYSLRLDVRSTHDPDPTQFAVLELTSIGHPVDRQKLERPGATFVQHQLDLLKFGGALSINDVSRDGRAAVVAKMTLLVRKEIRT